MLWSVADERAEFDPRPPARRAALGRPVDLFDVRRVDALLGASLERLAAAQRAWAAAGEPAAPLLVDGAPIDDLCLTFVLPGAPPPAPPRRARRGRQFALLSAGRLCA